MYKASWTPPREEWLVCKNDNRQEALEHDPNAVGFTKNLLRIAAWLSWTCTDRIVKTGSRLSGCIKEAFRFCSSLWEFEEKT